MKRICIFCGSSTGANPAYALAARDMGRAIAARGLELVYGGGRVGLMGAVAQGALDASGRVIGIIPEGLVDKELAYFGLTELHVVPTMHARKAMMSDVSDAFIALPGGFGTLEEFCELLSWAQIGIHRKPFGILNVEGYYDGLLHFFDYALAQQFISSRDRALIRVDTTADGLLDTLLTYQPPLANPLLEKSER